MFQKDDVRWLNRALEVYQHVPRCIDLADFPENSPVHTFSDVF